MKNREKSLTIKDFSLIIVQYATEGRFCLNVCKLR
mgnify:CR=1 FL=1